MTRPVRLSAKASARLDAILDWSADRFGLRQTERYRAQFMATFDRLGDGTVPSRSVRDVLVPQAPEDLRFVKAGSHFVLFRERAGVVEITDLLHEAMDLVGRARG